MTVEPASKPLSILHISDLHFRGGLSGTVYDDDQEQRQALARDIVSLLAERVVSPLDFLLISGDIASAGKPEEFSLADAWVTDLCRIAGLSRDNVGVVPGNHDLDRSLVESQVLTKEMHLKVRNAVNPELAQGILISYLQNPRAAEMLFEPLQAYNTFAADFNSTSSPPGENIVWSRTFALNDGSEAKVYGMNSALLCDANDDTHRDQLLLGTFQCRFDDQPEVVVITVFHHPFEYLKDFGTIRDRINARASLQLFGHRHTARVTPVGDSLVIGAGALHPDRGELNWKPGYNVIELSVSGVAASRKLIVRVTRRTWDDETRGFTGANDTGEYPLRLRSWLPVSTANQLIGMTLAATVSIEDTTMSEPTGKTDSQKSQELVQAFLDADESVRAKAAKTAGVFRDGDRFDTEEAILEIFKRATREEKLLEMLAAVAEKEGEPQAK
jgi:DNA repair exonuclease SbcCD nuclease subunit